MCTLYATDYVTEDRWGSLKDISAEQKRSLEEVVDDLRGFKDAYEQLSSQIGQWEKRVGVLGPLSTEPAMLNTQVQQVQVSVGKR